VIVVNPPDGPKEGARVAVEESTTTNAKEKK
jgi:hypothetical protein